jgi:SAM-dependent methyltransferase
VDTRDVEFAGDIPRLYDQYLGPVYFEPYARALAARVAAARPRRILEIACGTGIATEQLHAANHGATVVATDLNKPMIAFARAKLAGRDIEWREADGAALPFADASFDAVVCQFGYMFFRDKVVAFREAARVLTPEGALFFLVWSGPDENPSGRIAHEAMLAAFPNDPPMFARIPFGYGDAAVVRADLVAAGFREVTIDRVTFERDAPSAADVAIGLVRGTPMYNAIVERGGDVAAIEADVARRLRDLAGDSPLTLHMEAKAIAARR